MTTTLTVPIDSEKKTLLKSLAKKDGVTVTFLINQLIDFYEKGEVTFKLVQKDVDEGILENDLEFEEVARKMDFALSKIDISKIPSAEEQLKNW